MGRIKEKFTKNTLILTFLLGCSLFINWLAYYFGYYSVSSDESARILLSYHWYKTHLIESGTWLPLQFIITGIGFEFWEDLFLLPRLINSIFGMICIINIYFITDELFNNKRISIYSAVIAVFFPSRLILSSVPLPEIILIAFVTSGSLFFLKFIKKGNPAYLYSASIAFAIGSAARYEGWVLCFILFCYIIVRKIPAPSKVIVSLLLIIFPLYWIIFNFIDSHQAFSFFNTPVDIFEHKYGSSIKSLFVSNPLVQFIEQNFLTANIIGIPFLVVFIKKHRDVRLWILLLSAGLILLSVLTFVFKALPAHNFWRIPSAWSILLIPFTSYGIYNLISSCNKYFRVPSIPVSLLYMLLLMQFCYIGWCKIDDMKEEYCFTNEDKKIGGELMLYLDKYSGNSKIVIEETKTFNHVNIIISSTRPENFFYYKKGKIMPAVPNNTLRNNAPFYLFSKDQRMSIIKMGSFKEIINIMGWTLYRKNKY